MKTIKTRVGMPLDEFIRQNEVQPFELINGERKPRVSTIAGHNYVIRMLFLALVAYLSGRRLGEVFSEATFILPDADDSNWVEGSRTPDVMIIALERLEAYKAAFLDWKQRPYAIVPEFVAEVVSPTDSYSEVDEKVDAYLLDGVRLVWVIDPQRRKATVHAPDFERPLVLTEDKVLEGGDVLPDFRIALKMLFE